MDTMKVCLIFSTLFCLAYLATSKTVLVLGSGGFIGSHLTEKLKEDGHNVLEVRNRRHIDLREEGSLDVFKWGLSVNLLRYGSAYFTHLMQR